MRSIRSIRSIRTGLRWGVSAGVLAMALTMTAVSAASAPNGARGLSRAPTGLVAAMAQSAEREAARDPAYRIDRRGCAQLSVQRFTACFAPGATRFRTPHVALQLRLAAWGRPGRLTALALAPGRPHANRIEYLGSGIRAWWRVLPLGYEQGFTITRAPAGRGPVIIELRASRAPAIAGNSLAWGRLHYGQLVVTDARGRVLPATLTAVGRKVVLRFDAAHARYPLNVDPLVWVEQEVTASDGAASDIFGYSVALSGPTALVGAPQHQVGGNADQGAAYIYNKINGVWSQTAELTASDGAARDYFGNSVALNGTTALVGAVNHQVGSNGSQGAAYVYTETNGVWSQTAELTASDGAASDAFGYSVALIGPTALVGAPNHNSKVGAAYVFTGGSGIWSQAAELSLSGVTGDIELGYSVALIGPNTIALVGTPFIMIGAQTEQGAVFVYTEPAGGWTSTSSYTTRLTAGDGTAYDWFGTSLAGSGSNVLVGAPQHQVGSNIQQGAAYIYTDTNGSWSQTAELTASDGAASDMFGYSVALGPNALVGAVNHQVGSNGSQGAAYVYTEANNGTWSQTVELTASDGRLSDRFGMSLAGSGSNVLVGAPQHQVGSNTNQGAAYFFGNADLGLVLSTPAMVASGANYTSQAILTNNGSYTSPALSVLLPVPTGTNYVSSSATQGSCSQTAGTVTCNLGSLAASGGSASGSVTLQATAAAGTALANSANLALSTPALSQTSTTTVAVAPAVTGLANARVTIGQSVPAESFTISGTGSLTVTASSSNTTLLPNAGLSISSGCNANGAKCMLSITPAVGQTGTATVTVTVTDTNGQQGSGSFTLTIKDIPATANNDSVTTTAGQAVSGTLSASTAYQGQTLTYQLVTQPAHGTATLTNASTGAFTYTPTAGFSGSDSFTFNAKDSAGTLSNTATESLTVNALPSPPPSSGGGGGGGALGLWSLGSLLALLRTRWRLRPGSDPAPRTDSACGSME